MLVLKPDVGFGVNVVISLLVGVLVIVYGLLAHKKGWKDVLGTTLGTKKVTVWPLTRLVFFASMAFISMSGGVTMTVLNIFWTIIQFIMTSGTVSQKANYQLDKERWVEGADTQGEMMMIDFGFGMLGVVAGVVLRKWYMSRKGPKPTPRPPGLPNPSRIGYQE